MPLDKGGERRSIAALGRFDQQLIVRPIVAGSTVG
jgi:hypothetical protein